MIVLGVAAAVVLVAIGFWYWRLPSEDALLEERLRREAVVTLHSGAAFHGVLYEHDGKSLVLRDVEALGEPPHPAKVPVDGELLFRWSEVAYVQLP